MKTQIPLILLIFSVILCLSCDRNNDQILPEPDPEKVITLEISDISYTVAKSGGKFGAGFTPSTRGLCWNTTGDPSYDDNHIFNFDDDTLSFQSKFYNLKPNMTYYVKAFAVLNTEFYYGETKQFKTLDYDSIVDSRDGNTYKYVQIGEQFWLIDNLKYLPSINYPTDESDSIPMYYVYDYFGSNLEEAKVNQNYQTYGVLYNYKSVEQSCPAGWHIPTKVDWTNLKEYVEIDEKPLNLKSSPILRNQGTINEGTGLWNSDEEGINSLGFSAIPSGFRYTAGIFNELNERADYWVDNFDDYDNMGVVLIFNNNSDFTIYSGPESIKKDLGVSIRCIKDM